MTAPCSSASRDCSVRVPILTVPKGLDRLLPCNGPAYYPAIDLLAYGQACELVTLKGHEGSVMACDVSQAMRVIATAVHSSP